MNNNLKYRQLASTKLDKNKFACGKLVYGFCGGLCLAILCLFIVSLLGIEIRQNGHSAGKGIFFFVWAVNILSAVFAKNRLLVIRNISLLFALFSLAIPLIFFFKTGSNVWINTTVLWVNLSFILLGVSALAAFSWLSRICRHALT